ncbi:MAG TPA: NAD(P)/FAD-dependent oxidoreductase [Dehalococcoidia bacterium]|nr:NAD(P)/FAD-dependent oxidoreductase [Dehalococcoidia bacterium]
MYDAIVVGARCAGAPTAMLLAREGFRVLLLDRDTFPSDIMSTHYIHPPGVAALSQWGVLDAVLASGCPPLRRTSFALGPQVTVSEHDPEGRAIALCPRRHVLDKILVDAAVKAGVELREDFVVRDLLFAPDGAVTGITARDAAGRTVSEEARIVVGADGLHSRVARLVQPTEYNRVETLLCAYYSYFSGVEVERDCIYLYGTLGAGVLAFPTNRSLLCIAAARPRAQMAAFRANMEAAFFESIELANAEFAARVRAGRREERFLGTGDLPHYFRKPYGPGWALVGDAGLHLDPTNGLGITKAFSEVQLLAPALAAGLRGQRPMDEALAEYHARRDQQWVPLGQQNLEMSSAVGLAAPGRFRPWSEIEAEIAAAP